MTVNLDTAKRYRKIKLSPFFMIIKSFKVKLASTVLKYNV